MFILIYTRPDGTDRAVTKDDDGEPFARSHHAAMAMRTVFAKEDVAISVLEMQRAIRFVFTAPYSTPVTHEESGYTFRIDPV